MRITIEVDGDQQTVSRTQEAATGTSAPDETAGIAVSPPADLAARARALGALSAGPAPVPLASSGEAGAPGFPASTPGAPPVPGSGVTEADIPAGPAPDRPDDTTTIRVEQ
jgi:hypothetical protein